MFIFPSENIIHQHSYGNFGMPCDNCTFTLNTTRETSLIVHPMLYKRLLSWNSNYDVFFLDLILRRQSTQYEKKSLGQLRLKKCGIIKFRGANFRTLSTSHKLVLVHGDEISWIYQDEEQCFLIHWGIVIMVDKFCGTLYPNINPMSNQCDSRSNKYNIVTIENK